ncbi:hypothetical protein EDB89DRAFT_2173089 [Lactarius sanguifluus]|nr:hypothetical protein EDB89DRAFT_2173089 [Lactarius sanguifluus]
MSRDTDGQGTWELQLKKCLLLRRGSTITLSQTQTRVSVWAETEFVACPRTKSKPVESGPPTSHKSYAFRTCLEMSAVKPVSATVSYTLMDDMRVKHTWDAVPSTKILLGSTSVALPPTPQSTFTSHSGTTSRELHGQRSKCGVTSSATCSERVAELVTQYPDTPELVGSRLAYYGVAIFLHLDDTRQQLADGHWLARVPSRQTARPTFRSFLNDSNTTVPLGNVPRADSRRLRNLNRSIPKMYEMDPKYGTVGASGNSGREFNVQSPPSTVIPSLPRSASPAAIQTVTYFKLQILD